MKRFISFVLALTMAICALPMSVVAEESEASPSVFDEQGEIVDPSLQEQNSFDGIPDVPEGSQASDEISDVTVENQTSTDMSSMQSEPFSAGDSDVILSGYCGGEGDGTNATWEITQNGDYYVLTIRGSGRMADYSLKGSYVYYTASTAPWCSYAGSRSVHSYGSYINSVVIEKGITYIGSCAFAYLQKLSEVSIPNTVEEIGTYAFTPHRNEIGANTNGSLTSIVIPEGVKYIDEGAFFNTRIETVILPNTLLEIGDNAFQCCKMLANIELPNSLEKIGSLAFDCTKLTNIYIPANVRDIHIWYSSFQECVNLQSIYVDPQNATYASDEHGILFSKDMKTLCIFPGGSILQSYDIPEYVEEISSGAFSYSQHLKNVVIPNSVKKIGSYAFYNSNIENVEMFCSDAKWGNSVFYHSEKLKYIKLPEKMKSIEGDTFSGCLSLTSIEIPEGITTIGSHAFGYCPNLVSVIIPDGVTTIGKYAFRSCYNLASVTIPKSVTSMHWEIHRENNAFTDCKKLVIYGYSNSYIETYAKRHRLKFVPLDFDPDMYLAKEAILGSLGVDPIYSGDTPCEIAANAVEASKANDLYNSWTAVTKVVDSLVSDPGTGVRYLTVDKIDMYTAIIMSSLQTSYEINAFTSVKKAYKPISDVSLGFYNYISARQDYDVNLGLHDLVASGEITDDDKAYIKKLVEYKYTEKFGKTIVEDTKMSKDFDKFFNKALSAASTFDDFANTTCSYFIMLSLSSDMQKIIQQLYASCPDSNWALKQALKRCDEIIADGYKDFVNHAIEEGVYAAGSFAVESLAKELWNKFVLQKIKIAFPGVCVMIEVYKLTKNLTNYVTNIDGTSQAYYDMLATLDFEHLVEDVYRTNLNTFSSNMDLESARAYLNTANLIMQAQIVDAGKAKAFWKALDKGWFTFISELTSGTKVSYWIDEADNFKGLVERKQEIFNESWRTILMEKYPEIFNTYVPDYDIFNEVMRTIVVKGVINSNIYCYDANNNLVASYIDGVVHTCNSVSIIVDGSEVKFVFLDNNEYTVIVDGNSENTIDVTDTSFADGKEANIKNYYSVSVSEGENITIDNAISRNNGNIITPDYDSSSSVKNYTLSIENGYITGENNTSRTIDVSFGEKIEISAYVPLAKEFLGWTSNIGTDIFESSSSVTTTVTVPNSDVVITAIINTLPEHTHAVVEDAYVAPTCASYGHTAGTHCLECGEVLSGNELITQTGEHIDALPDGTCSICGGIADGIAKLDSRSLSLSGNIAVNFYVQMDEALTADELADVCMKFTLSDGTVTSMPYQAKENKIIRLSEREAYPMLLNQSYRPGSIEKTFRVMELVKKLVRIPTFSLSCNISDEAVVTAFNALKDL